MHHLVCVFILVLTLATLNVLDVAAMTYSVTTHYYDADTSCSNTPYRIEVNEDTQGECTNSSCAASANGLYDGVAVTTCTQDYQNEIWKRFGSSVYILLAVYHDSVCSNFAYARAYLASGKCEAGYTDWVVAKIESNGSATVQYFTSKACSPDDLFLSTDHADQAAVNTEACENEVQWFTNQGNTAAPLAAVTSTDPGSSSQGESTTTDTPKATSATGTESTIAPATDNVHTSSSSGSGGSGMGAGEIAGIAVSAVTALTVVIGILKKQYPDTVEINCFRF